MFQEHEDHAAELLPVVAADDGLLVGLGDSADYNRMPEPLSTGSFRTEAKLEVEHLSLGRYAHWTRTSGKQSIKT